MSPLAATSVHSIVTITPAALLELAALRDTEPDAGDSQHDREWAEPVHGDLFDRVDDRHHGEHRQRDADRVDAARVRVAALGHDERREDEQRQQHGHRHDEHRAPREVLEQQSADDRAERGAG